MKLTLLLAFATAALATPIPSTTVVTRVHEGLPPDALGGVFVTGFTEDSGTYLMEFNTGPWLTATGGSWEFTNTFGASFTGLLIEGVTLDPFKHADGVDVLFGRAFFEGDRPSSSRPMSSFTYSELLQIPNYNEPYPLFGNLQINWLTPIKQGESVSFYAEGGTLVTTPEPISMALVGSGLVGLGFLRRKKAIA